MYDLQWTAEARASHDKLRVAAEPRPGRRKKAGSTKSSKQEGLFRQINKALRLLASNPKHRSLQTHEFTSLANPHDPMAKVFVAYAQNNTSAAYRVFWCYGPERREITIIKITPHPS